MIRAAGASSHSRNRRRSCRVRDSFGQVQNPPAQTNPEAFGSGDQTPDYRQGGYRLGPLHGPFPSRTASMRASS